MEAASLSATELACRRGDRLLFRGLSIHLQGGEALQVAGPNGTGKSSLLRILAGLLRPYAGSVQRTAEVALLDERLPLDGDLPLGRALEFWQRIDRGVYGAESMTGLGLTPLADVPVRYLSTGQRKRAAILQSNARRAGIWLLDEPLNGLDRQAATAFQGQVSDYLAQGGIAVIASHQPFDAPALRVLELADFAA